MLRGVGMFDQPPPPRLSCPRPWRAQLVVPFEACVRQWLAPLTADGFISPVTGTAGIAATTLRLLSRPRYLVLVMSRYTLAADWTALKIDASVPMPRTLDLEALGLAATHEGPAAGEVALPSGDGAGAGGGGGSAGAAPAVVPDPSLVAMLESMGFPEGAIKRALVATGNAGAEVAMEWVMSHGDDADFADPYVPPAPAPAPAPAAGGDVDPEALSMLVDAMGFEPARAKYALRQCGGSVERAADWLFSHTDDPIPDESAPAPAAAAGGAAPAWLTADKAAPGRYHMAAIVSHLGNNTASGHYVCHIRKSRTTGKMTRGDDADAGWYIFNDSKVAESQEPPFDLGYMYVYRRDDLP